MGPDAGEVDIGCIGDEVAVDDLAAGMDGVGNPLRRRPAIADIVLDAEIALRTTGIVAGAEHQAAEGLVVPDQMAGRRRRQQPVLAHQHRPEAVGRGDADRLLDGDIIEVAAIAADHQRLALVALQAVEDRLHEVLDIVRLAEHLDALAQSGGSRLLVVEGRGFNRLDRHRVSGPGGWSRGWRISARSPPTKHRYSCRAAASSSRPSRVRTAGWRAGSPPPAPLR